MGRYMRPARNWGRPVLAAGAVAVFWASGVAAGLAATGVYAALYAWSLVRHPWRPCWRCGGSAARWSWIWQGAGGGCRVCGNRKTQVRWGVKVLMPGYARRLRQRKPTRYG